MEFESSEQKNAPRSHVCVVYDPRDGRIVHGHEFVGGGAGLFDPDGREERERETLEGARRNHGDLAHLRVFHAPADFRFAPNVAYRVDTRSNRLVEHRRWSPERHGANKVPARQAAARKTKT